MERIALTTEVADSERFLEFGAVKLGKRFDLKYIPFSELAVPWNVCIESIESKQEKGTIEHSDRSSSSVGSQFNPENPKATRILNDGDLGSLKRSIARYGLLKPFEVAEMQERLGFFYGGGRYLIIDGQRRYFAIRDLLKLPTEDEERKRKESLRTDSGCDNVLDVEMQAQKQFEKLCISDYVLIPCLVYPYTTLLQMVRHSIEDKRFSERPSKEDFELAHSMSKQGISDLGSDDLTELWNTRPRIEEERASVVKTLEEIRKKLKREYS